jgi:hypothetical protein
MTLSPCHCDSSDDLTHHMAIGCYYYTCLWPAIRINVFDHDVQRAVLRDPCFRFRTSLTHPSCLHHCFSPSVTLGVNIWSLSAQPGSVRAWRSSTSAVKGDTCSATSTGSRQQAGMAGARPNPQQLRKVGVRAASQVASQLQQQHGRSQLTSCCSCSCWPDGHVLPCDSSAHV